jgi:ethanolamine utilization protein EutS
MEERVTREELLEKLFNDDYEHLKGKKLRMTRVRVPGKSIDFAHVFTPSDPSVYQNLALHIGVHEGEDHTGESIGIIRITPWEAIVVATDVAVKAADVEVGFMDRFSGAMIILGGLSQVLTAIEEVVRFFRDELNFNVCEIHKS